MKKNAIINALNTRKARSTWDKAVIVYARDILNAINYIDDISCMDDLLNGASTWTQYSWGGCSLCCNWQIAERCCTPSELKRTDNGNKRPNTHEEWLDVQARALYQAAHIILNIVKEG